MHKQLSPHAATAHAIRQELKKAFPATKFSVTSSSYSGGDSVVVNWQNGPTYKDVDSVVDKYQYGHFNCMEDIYENSNNRTDIPQVKFVQTRREITQDTLAQVFAWLQETHAHFDCVSTIDEYSNTLMEHWCAGNAWDYIHRILNKFDLTDGFDAETYIENYA